MRLRFLGGWAILMVAGSAPAQVTFETAELEQAVASGFDFFGWALDLDGDDAAIGVPGYDLAGDDDVGHVQMFSRSGSSWTAGQLLTASDGAPGDSFGRAIALVGDELLIGATFADVGGASLAGAVYVFRRQGGIWSEVDKLTASDSVANARFGSALAVDGDVAIVGSVAYPPTPTSSGGQAYVLERIGGTWIETQVLKGDVELAQDFSWSVDVHADRIVVGSPKGDPPGLFNAGTAHVFDRMGGSFVETARLSPAGAVSNDRLGESVAIWGDVLVAGSPLHDTGDHRGAVFVFEWDGSAWNEIDKLIEPDDVQLTGLGREVAIEGDRIAVQNGAWFVGQLAQIGSVVVYRRSDCGFLPEARLMGQALGNFAGFGHALAFSGDTLIGGGSFWQNDTVYAFDLDPAAAATSYCTAGTTSNGCQATLAACGTASVAGFGPFPVSAANVEGSKNGMFILGFAPLGLPWGAGSSSFLCIQPPLVRTDLLFSGGTAGQCDGSFTLDLNAWMEANPGKAPAVGTDGYVQAWFRDPTSPKASSLSDAIAFPVGL